MKKCNKCGRLLDETMFHKNKDSKDGLTSLCKDCRNKANRIYYNNEEIKERKRLYKQNYDKEHRIQKKEYMDEYINRPGIKQQRMNYQINRYRTDIRFRLDSLTINVCSRVLSGKTKCPDCLEQRCGFTAQQLREHIESQFTPEMNWSNYGTYWELDHIIPRFKFYYESYDDEQFKQCWALSNLRPLEVKVNRCRSKT